ncbi:MAG: hypothetical protein AABZ65_04155 [Candidatus Omnitrophota bacterium]
MEREDISFDEEEILEGWRMVKKHRKGYIRVMLKSDGTQYYLEISPAKEGKIINNRLNLREISNRPRP